MIEEVGDASKELLGCRSDNFYELMQSFDRIFNCYNQDDFEVSIFYEVYFLCDLS